MMLMFRSRRFLSALLLSLPTFLAIQAAHASDTDGAFIAPTKEELAMKDLPGYPGAAAVVLNREEEDLDDLHVVHRYERIKILTEKGKDLANVQLKYASLTDVGANDFSDYKSLGDIQGRTIHPDGTIIPFKGKPYVKVLEKEGGIKVQELVFTLPEVEVGSIIEYKYSTRVDDNAYEAPDWIIQGPYYVKSAHYLWKATRHELLGESGHIETNISWFPILPDGVKVEAREIPAGVAPGGELAPRTFEVQVHDIPPAPEDDYMPPISSFTYRVLFNFTEYHSAAEYWKDTGKRWAKRLDSFAEANGDLKSATNAVTAGATTPEDKLRKIYVAVEGLENTRFTRERDKQENKAAGLTKMNHASDVWQRKRGTPYELTELFIGMARAAGFKAYAMLVPDRTHDMFAPLWLNMGQFDDLIAVVNLDGKDVFFDPGMRYTPFAHLAWQHTFLEGLRETDDGTAFGQTDGDGYKFNHTSRVANLTMSDDGTVSGTVQVRFSGAAGAEWRQTALEGDAQGLNKSLEKYLEKMLPSTVDVKVDQIANVDDYEQPLVVSYTIKGAVGTPMGKRLMVPADLFVAHEAAMFPQEKRELAVYFRYPEYMQDAVRIFLPASMTVEATPDKGHVVFMNRGVSNETVETSPKYVTTRRDFVMAEFLVLPKDYGTLRTFYSQTEAKDREPIVLKTGAPVQAAVPAAVKTAAAAGSGQ